MFQKFGLLFIYGMFNATGVLHFLKQGRPEEDALFLSSVYSLLVAVTLTLGYQAIIKKWSARRSGKPAPLDLE